jgi:uncharacterized Zn-binding protein involved in type VI secretion
MTTATQEAPVVPATPVPVEPDLASIFYDVPQAKDGNATTAPAPQPVSETGPVTTPTVESVTAADQTKTDGAPVGTEPQDTKKPAEEKGHAAAARRLGSEVAELKRGAAALAEENRVLKAKLDGTYEEPTQPSTEEVTARAEFKGRETASRAIAEGVYGAEIVQAQVYDDGSPYKTLVSEKPWLHARVAKNAQPTVEAMRVLKEQEFFKTYGEDVSKWVEKIEAQLKPKLLDEFKKHATIPVTGTPAPTITEARGSGGPTKETSLAELFYGGPPVI